MNSNQSLRQASVRAVTGTAYNYEGDWSALFTAAGFTTGSWNERFLLWLNSQMGANYTDLPGAMQAFAEYNGVYNWDSLGTFTATDANFLVQETGAPNTFLLESGTYSLLLES